MARSLLPSLFLALVALAGPSSAHAFYCEGGMVAVGDRADEVRSVCGAPVHESSETMVTRTRVRDPLRGYWVSMNVTHIVTVWTFDFGPTRLVQQVVIDGGLVTEIREGARGAADLSSRPRRVGPIPPRD
jgi:hypothetical protein